MFFCRRSRQWLKPVREMRNALGFRPGPDPIRDLGRHRAVDLLAGFYGTHQAFERFVAQELARHLVRKYIFSKNGCDFLGIAWLNLLGAQKAIKSIKTQ